MNDPLTLAIVDALHAEEIAFILVGSLSSNLCRIPRSTRDADFVIELRCGRIFLGGGERNDTLRKV